jgi:hypothetical protein
VAAALRTGVVAWRRRDVAVNAIAAPNVETNRVRKGDQPMALLRFLLLFSLIAAFSGSAIDPNGGGAVGSYGGGAMDPNGSVTDDGPGIDPDGATLCYTVCVDPNG